MPSGKVILITGCSSGMGMESAVALAKRGHRVYATMRDLNKRGNLEKRLAEEGTSTEIMRLDVTDDNTIDDCLNNISRKEERLDVLINNAGIGLRAPLEAATIREIEELFDTNFLGVVRCIQAVLPTMKKQKSGLIINVSSAIGVIGIAFASVYGASKFAIEGLSESLCEELRHFNIKLRLIEPGIIETNFGSNIIQGTRVYRQDAPYLQVVKNWQETRARLMRQSSQEAAMTYVDAVEDESEQFRFQTGEMAALTVQKKFINHLMFTPLST